MKFSINLLRLVADEPEQVIKVADELNKTTDRGYGMMQELLVFAQKTEARLFPGRYNRTD